MFVDSMDCFLTYNFTCINNTFTQFNSSSVVFGDALSPNQVNGAASGSSRSHVDLISSSSSSSSLSAHPHSTSPSILVSVQHCIFTAIILGAIILSTITGNILVIAAVKLEKSLHSVAYYLFVSLAVADLMVASMVMPIAVLKEVTRSWVLGSIICDAWVMIDLLCCTASILHLVAIALDRYWSITNLDYATKRTPGRILILICVIWVTSILIAGSHLFPVFRDKRGRPSDQCHLIGNVPFTILSTVGAFYIPLIVMCIIYWKIFQAAKFRIRRRAFNNNNNNHNRTATPMDISSTTGNLIKATPAYTNHQQDLTSSTPTTPSNHQPSTKKRKKYQSFSPSEFHRLALKNFQLSNHQSKRTVNESDSPVIYVATNNQSSHDHQLKPMKKASYSMLKKDAGSVVTVTTPVLQLSTSNRLQIDHHEDQHELQILPSNTSHRHSIPSDGIAPMDTVSNLIISSSPTPPQTFETPTFKSLPTTVITDMNHLHANSNNTTVLSRPAPTVRKKIDIKRERKATKVLGVVMGCFILCWLPFFLEETICGIFHLTINEKIISVLTWLGYLNSLLNPVIYTIFAPDFRQAFGKILFGKYRKRRRRLKK